MSPSHSSRSGAMVILIASLAGLAIALYAYFTPLTGVTGTLGALVAIVACIALMVMALLLVSITKRSVSIALRVLILVGLAGTLFAGVLLHQWWLCAAMVMGFVGLILDMITPHNTHPAHA